ncbi:MAG: phosphatidate cytidylyltransferase [Paracoccaceae bacterium]
MNDDDKLEDIDKIEVEPEPADDPFAFKPDELAGAPKPGGFADLRLRIVSGVVLAVAALAFFYLGGIWTSGMLAVGGALMMWEYRGLITGKYGVTDIRLLVMAAGAIGAALVGQIFGLVWAMIPLGLAVVAIVAARKTSWLWLALGVVYFGLPVAALAHYRGETIAGLLLVYWLIAVVVATDIGGYFVGRAVGGPKLWPAVSPGKTWSGTLGGWGLAAVVGLGFGLFAPGWPLWSTVTLSLLLAVSAQIGDLGESWLKRRKGVKDSSALIPGHGGILDRLDGLVAAVNVYVLTLVF